MARPPRAATVERTSRSAVAESAAGAGVEVLVVEVGVAGVEVET